MTKEEKLEAVLKSFSRYYTIKEENVTFPFDAEAEFRSHSEQFVLVKAAKVAEIDSNEFVFFKTEERLSADKLNLYDKKAWEEGMSRVKPHSSHKNSDVILVIIADSIDDDAFSLIRKMKHYKSYKFSFYGYSNYKLIAIDLKNDRLTFNRQGRTLKEVVNNK